MRINVTDAFFCCAYICDCVDENNIYDDHLQEVNLSVLGSRCAESSICTDANNGAAHCEVGGANSTVRNISSST